MRLRTGTTAVLAGAVLLAAALPAANGVAAPTTATAGTLAACSAPAWAEGVSYPAGTRVSYLGHLYESLVTHTPPAGAGWNPAAVPALWRDLGVCTGTPSPTPTATPTRTPTPT
ncbi:glycoside hydrolase family 18, partial [Micromonospora wenchangensis]